MSSLLLYCTACLTLLLSILIIYFSVRILSRFQRSNRVTGRIFLRGNRFLRVTLSFAAGVSLILLANLLFLGTYSTAMPHLLKSVGTITASSSLLFFLYALYEFYEIVR